MKNKVVTYILLADDKNAMNKEAHRSLSKLNNTTVLDYNISTLNEAGYNDITVVVSPRDVEHYKSIMSDTVRILSPTENPSQMGTLKSVLLDYVSRSIGWDIAILDGDLMYDVDAIKTIFNQTNVVCYDSTSKVQGTSGYFLGRRLASLEPFVDCDQYALTGICVLDMFSVNMALSTAQTEFDDTVMYEKCLCSKYAVGFRDTHVDGFDIAKLHVLEINSNDDLAKARGLFIDVSYLKKKAIELGAVDVYSTKPDRLIFDDRVRLQCFNCKNYGVKHTCPPHLENIDFEALIKKYRMCLFVIVHRDFNTEEEFDKIRTESTNTLHKILLALEKEAFSQDNHYTTSFIGGSCKLCKECAPDRCRQPAKSRIPLEATGVDVVETMKKFGMQLKFPVSNDLYRVGMLLIG